MKKHSACDEEAVVPLRIAVFTETFLPKIDGIVTILCLMLQRLQEQGHTVMVFGPPGGPEEYAGAKVIGVGGPRLPFYPEVRINIPKRRIYEQLEQFQPDLIHIVNPFFLGPFGLSYARRLNVPTLASYHTDIPRYVHHYHGGGFVEPAIWWYLRSLHNQASLNLCPSTSTLRDLREHGFKRVRWWKRGIDLQRFTPGPRDLAMRNRLSGGNPQDFLVINVGRHAVEKRLETMRAPLFGKPGVRLAMIGDGPHHANLRGYYRDTPTVFTGALRGDDLINAYRAADAFIFPSTTETFGLVALEAMACRVPVIAARTGGVQDIIEDGVNGLFFEADKPEQIGPLVRRLRDDDALRETLIENGYDHARGRSWQATMDQLIEYYRTAIRVHRQRGPAGAGRARLRRLARI
ncbi:MAG: glycosyltransferase family 1 protein [Roseiflexaceae bacterium]|nr:glycosyltransferase family 1 protein [Roseiflexaceae bacterium]